jgi:hypothetical protein
MINLIKVEIFEKNRHFDILFKEYRKKYFFHRENRINEILDEKIENIMPLIFGEPYEDDLMPLRKNNASHIIEFLSIENDKYYGYIKILDTPSGKKFIEFKDNLILRPIYRGSKFDSSGQSGSEILTFDIEIDKREIYKRILNR